MLAQVDAALDATELTELLNALLDTRLDDTKELTDELTTGVEERIAEDNTEDATDERTEDGALDETTLEETAEADEPAALQIAPVTAGASTAPLVLTCTPKDTVCPGGMLLFQSRLVAEYGLVPVRVAFQLLVMRLFT